MFLKLAKPDEDRFSRLIFIAMLEKNGLSFGNGRSSCRDDSAFGELYNIEKRKQGNKIIGAQLHGFKKQMINKTIPANIKKAIQKKRGVILVVSKVEIEHKDGHRGNLVNIKTQRK